MKNRPEGLFSEDEARPAGPAYLLDGVITSMVFSITLPVTDTPVDTTAPATLTTATAADPARLTTPQPLRLATASSASVGVQIGRASCRERVCYPV